MVTTANGQSFAVVDASIPVLAQRTAKSSVRFGDLLTTYGKAISDGVLTDQERHELSLCAAILAAEVEELSKALEGPRT